MAGTASEHLSLVRKILPVRHEQTVLDHFADDGHCRDFVQKGRRASMSGKRALRACQHWVVAGFFRKDEQISVWGFHHPDRLVKLTSPPTVSAKRRKADSIRSISATVNATGNRLNAETKPDTVAPKSS